MSCAVRAWELPAMCVAFLQESAGVSKLHEFMCFRIIPQDVHVAVRCRRREAVQVSVHHRLRVVMCVCIDACKKNVSDA